MSNSGSFVTPYLRPEQLRLDLQIAAERDIDGVGMGVLSNGVPFLTIRGLGRMCGVDSSAITRITADWILSPLKPREMKIRELVRAQGADDSVAFIGVQKAGVIYHRGHDYPPTRCLAGSRGILEIKPQITISLGARENKSEPREPNGG